MPSVTMNPCSPNRTINAALAIPTRAPTSRVIGMDQAPGMSPMPWPAPTATVIQAATPGARPKVDSSERSILPATRTMV
jgi:hypothetical protein